MMKMKKLMLFHDLKDNIIMAKLKQKNMKMKLKKK